MALRVHDAILEVDIPSLIEDYSWMRKDEAIHASFCKLIDATMPFIPALKFDDNYLIILSPIYILSFLENIFDGSVFSTNMLFWI